MDTSFLCQEKKEILRFLNCFQLKLKKKKKFLTLKGNILKMPKWFRRLSPINLQRVLEAKISVTSKIWLRTSLKIKKAEEFQPKSNMKLSKTKQLNITLSPYAECAQSGKRYIADLGKLVRWPGSLTQILKKFISDETKNYGSSCNGRMFFYLSV